MSQLRAQPGSAERFQVPAEVRPMLVRALGQDLRGRDASGRLERILRLAAAFDGSLASPAIAQLLRDLLKEDPRALELLRRRGARRSGIDLVRSFGLSEGRPVSILAPHVDEPAPPGAVPARSFLTPARPRALRLTGRRSVRAR